MKRPVRSLPSLGSPPTIPYRGQTSGPVHAPEGLVIAQRDVSLMAEAELLALQLMQRRGTP